MKALLSGGPAEGVIDTMGVETTDGRCWTVSIIHKRCACKWCETTALGTPVDEREVEYVYEARDDGVFVFRIGITEIKP